MDAISGVEVSKPAKLSVFLSVGSAIVKQFPVIPMTISFAWIPVRTRYLTRADWGCSFGAYVSLSVSMMKASTCRFFSTSFWAWLRFLAAGLSIT